MRRFFFLLLLLLPTATLYAQSDSFTARTIPVYSKLHSMIVSDDGRLAATHELGVIHNDEIFPEMLPIRVFDIEAGEEIHTLEGHTDYAVALAFNDDATVLASLHAVGWIYLWDMESGDLIKQIPAAPGNTPIAFVPGSNQLIQVSNGGLIPLMLVWDLDSEAIVSIIADRPVTLEAARARFDDNPIPQAEQLVMLLPFSDGETVFTATLLDTVLRWNIQTGEFSRLFAAESENAIFNILDLVVSEDGQTLFVPHLGNDTITVINAETGAELEVYDFSEVRLGPRVPIDLDGDIIVYVTRPDNELTFNIAPLSNLMDAEQIALVDFEEIADLVAFTPRLNMDIYDGGNRIVVGGFAARDAPETNKILILER